MEHKSERQLNASECLQQIIAYYQPQIHIRTGALYGAEALARWDSDGSGVRGPGDIFAVLETYSERRALWKKMLCHTGVTFRRLKGVELNIAVNVCADIAASVDWAEELSLFFNQHDLNPKNFTVEITESSSHNSELSLSETVEQLRLRGFSCAIDDFGVGFSSLQRLATIAFSKLKIDKSFIHGARANVSGRKLIQHTVLLARDLGLTTIAEGIETEEDYDLARKLDVDIAQGFFIAKPMSSEKFISFVQSYRTFFP
ncbi:EAL domain-containing protein [Pseudomonas sp. Irchel s3a12]|uniref:EAL domain-containing protein n=1 Tax=Pseudomonas sp. Irchel s3a12 TaxID=2009047 RepID=UPI001595EC6A|nr:EAL domain-containing protein [Pseudomonas sp. Irchel s3a12]